MNPKGFSLVELLVVVALSAFLSYMLIIEIFSVGSTQYFLNPSDCTVTLFEDNLVDEDIVSQAKSSRANCLARKEMIRNLELEINGD